MIRETVSAVVLCSPLFFLEAGFCADVPTNLIRLAVIDDSGSMKGSRVQTVRDELRKVARQLPPSPTHPFGLITFGSTAESVQWYTDPTRFERAVERLTGGSGGTNIASGLEEAAAAVRSRLKSGNLCLLLYTDGEDGNTSGILKAEAQLDALFAQRQQSGLSQSVFVKRWGNANSTLVKQLQQHGRATIVDAGELAILPLTFSPSIRVLESVWETRQDARLRVTFSPELVVRGHQGSLAPVAMTCLTHGATGHVKSLVVPNHSQPLRRTVSIPVTDSQLRAGQVTLEFNVESPAGQHTTSGIVLPSLATNRVKTIVRLPIRIVGRKLSASLALNGQAKWHDPLQRIAAFPVRLTVGFTTKGGNGGTERGKFQIVQDTPCELLNGTTEFELIANQPKTLPLTFTASSSSTKPSTYQVGLTVIPVSAQAGVEYVPARVHTELTGLTGPAAVTTTITTTVTGQSACHWVNLATCTARFSADVEFEVRGPMTPGERIMLVGPPEVAAFEFSPEILHTGSQTVRFTIDVRLAPHPRQTTLSFAIKPPPPQGGVRFGNPRPIRLQVQGPPAVSLAAAVGNQLPAQLTTAIADNVTSASLNFTPILNGAAADIAQGMSADVSASGSGIATSSAAITPLFTNTQTEIRITPPASRPFFRDVLVEGQVLLRTDPPTAAVQPVSYPLEIAVRAPFKRLAFLLAVSLSGLLTFLLLTRLYVKLRSTDVSS
ncbi:MAG: VWA domain-containing protein [Planctomycetaceae bacterium]|nr:VWA domain-containing protein [Planctomycetaceae bacterium]